MKYRQQQQQQQQHKSSDASSSAGASVTSSSVSVTSGYRHTANGPFMPLSGSSPKQTLMEDAKHQPKTRGSFGVLVVGLGGANGTTLLAGILANRLHLEWRGPQGQLQTTPNYNGCITQLDQKAGGVGYRDVVKGLADANMAAVGGWDIRPTKPGDALLDAQILDYDLVRQLQDEMNKTKIFRGLYDPRFIGTSQHDTATFVLTEQEAKSDAEALKCLRADIRYFKWRNGVVGHTTVIWSASVEPNSELVTKIKTARDLLELIDMSEDQRGGALPPSLMYATAALLEGCSFVNGASQNTLSCPGLADLAQNQQVGVYCLGTDFKAGQTKFKTAAVEYLRTMGLTPKVIASSNHLGNNDMRNLATSPATSAAKLRVKHDIFAPWQEEELDHKVSIMFTPHINDDKRDFVEYTSSAFLGQTHTMVTYTRASDSVLCVPLMIDAAVWCDYFSGRSWPYEKVAQALAYLFKVPEGAAKGVDPGFFRQMEELKTQVLAAHESKIKQRQESGSTINNGQAKRRVRIRPEQKTTEWAIPHDARVICAGLACVDMQLNNASGGNGGESIEAFEGEKSIGGGSVSMACKTLARLCHGAPLDDGYMQITPPVVHSIIPLCKIGNDDTGTKLIGLLEDCGTACRNVDTRIIKNTRGGGNPNTRTALSVLPIYRDGRRGCFFDAAGNTTWTTKELVESFSHLASASTGPAIDTTRMSSEELEKYQDDVEAHTPAYGSFLFGYPHLLPKMQGGALAQLFLEARGIMIEGGLTALDLNGVPEISFSRKDSLRSAHDLRHDLVIGAALEHVDLLHMNEDELVLLTGCVVKGTRASELEDEFNIVRAVNLFLMCGVGVVAVTRGKKGSYIACNNVDRFRRSPMLPASWVDCSTHMQASELPPGTRINTNGAGDSFTSGLLVAAMLRHTGMSVPVRNVDDKADETMISEASFDIPSYPPDPPARHSAIGNKKTLTPYTLYMRENYVSLKRQCKDDKKAIFTKCNEMWEKESDDVKAMYERMVKEENEKENGSEISMRVMDDIETLDSNRHQHPPEEHTVPKKRNKYMTNRALNLESAVQFASLVAAHHIDMSTRDLSHIDVSRLLERAMIFPQGFEEI